MKEIQIGSKKIGSHHKPFIVAEMSGNHNQSLEKALNIVDAAAECGVDAIKIQTYTADTMTLNLQEKEFLIRDPQSLWNKKSLYQLYQEAHTPWEWHKKIFDRCHEKNMICFSTPFDVTAVDFLETLSLPCYKIASFENTDLPLIRKVAQTGKPLIISTGMATEEELEETVHTARKSGCKDLILLKCTSHYPASPKDAHLRTLLHMQNRFQCWAGLSDHTLGVAVAVASVALGAVLIEKHFTLDRSEGGVDAAFSLEPHEMKQLVKETTRAWEALGKVHYGPTESEKASLQFRRSLYIVSDLKKGEVLTEKNLRAIRPGLGLPPKHYEEVLGKPIICDVKKGTPLSWDLVEK